MSKKFVFRSNKYNITHQDAERGIENRGYVDENPNTSTQTSALDKWYKYTAARDDVNIFPSSSANVSRIQIHDAISRYLDYVSLSVESLSVEQHKDYVVGYNFNKQKIYNYVEEYLLKNPSESLVFTKDPQQFLINLPGLNIKNILVYQGGQELSNTTLPALKTNIGEVVGHHKDGRFEKGLQGPFTEQNVGGYKHRHQPIGTTADRPERFQLTDNGTSLTFASPVKTDGNKPYARFSRDFFAKSVINIKNIRLNENNKSGNYFKTYEIVNGLSRRNQNLALVDRPQNFVAVNVDSPYVSGVIERALPDRRLADGTYTRAIFVNKFGAPGDVNSTNPNFMDAESEELTPYNTINYRNSTPRFYLKSYLSSPAYFGGYRSGSFGVSASYQKTQRNNRRVPISGTTNFKLREDNAYVSYGIPARDGGYSWINRNALTGNNPGLYTNGIDNDILFFTSSEEGANLSGISQVFPPAYGTLGYYDNYMISTYSSSFTPLTPSLFRWYVLSTGNRLKFTPKQQLSSERNKVILYQRKNNIFTDEIAKPGSNSLQPVNVKDSFIKDKYTNIKVAYHLSGRDEETLSYPFTQDYTSVVSTHYDAADNTIKNFYRNNKNIFYSDKSKSLFKRMFEFNKYVESRGIPVKTIKEIKQEEKLYPRSQNVFRNFARVRNNYTQKWSDSLDNRLTELTNSQGRIYTNNNLLNKNSSGEYKFSSWPLDSYTNYNQDVAYIIRDKSGELVQLDNINSYYTIYGNDPSTIVPSGSYFGARFGRNWNKNRPANDVHQQAGRGPYPSSYDEFASDIKLIGQECSVLPEYRISPRLDEYYQNNYSVYDSRFNQVELTGSVIENYASAVSTSSAFLEQRATTDYFDLAPFLNKELDQFKLNSIKVSVKAIKKLLPYEEFYPQIRTLNLAQQFSSSYNEIFTLAGTQATFRTALTPFYSPGICYNSIKAGVGLPYSVVSAIDAGGNPYTNITSSVGSASNYYKKLGWETILYPYSNLSVLQNQKIYDVDSKMIIDSTASILTNANYNSIYDKKASNFYAEVVNFYKSSSTLSSLKSKSNESWYFPDLTKKYIMDIVISKQSDFYTYSYLEAYGQKPYVFHAPPWSYVTLASATSSLDNPATDYVPNDQGNSGEAYARIEFDPSLMFIGSQDYAIKGKYNLSDIIRHSNISYYGSVLRGATTSSIINVDDIVDVFSLANDNKSWQPRIRWECPSADLNFYNLSASLTNSSGYDRDGDTAGSAIRGVWHQYAPLSKVNDGLFMYPRYTSIDAANTGSLLEAVGFDPLYKEKLGKIAESKEISETILLIPFYMDECGVEKYIDFDIDIFERMYGSNLGIIGKIKETSRNYILPPSLDYIRARELAGSRMEKAQYKNVKSPFLMFPVEFTHTLSRQDLADIWQGVMPGISDAAKVETKEQEFFIGKYLEELNYKLPDNTRFKIFKVKKRAVSNYQQIVDKTLGKEYIDYSYGYNWPYDYFSLVEMAEVKAELRYSYNVEDDSERNTRISPTRILVLDELRQNNQQSETNDMQGRELQELTLDGETPQATSFLAS